MLPALLSTCQPSGHTATGADASISDIGVGIDTARYGHYAAFLDADLQPAAAELEVAESAQGHGKLRQRLVDLVHKHGRVRFLVRLDVAGASADNLLAWLQKLAINRAAFSISCGDPQGNKHYRAAVFGAKKSDPIEARACARYAISERPKPMPAVSTERQRLRHVALRLQAAVKQRPRLVNPLHQLLARTYPELAMLVKDITAGWVLELLTRYPTARLLARAPTADRPAVPYWPHGRIDELLTAAGDSLGSRDGEPAEQLVRDHVRQVRAIDARQKRLEHLLIAAYRDRPEPNHLDSISGFGAITAGILTAVVADSDAVHSPGPLVNYFGIWPIEVSSGGDRDGQPRGPKRYVMSRRGNELVRRYLWMAALAAARSNPAGRALYARGRAKHPDRPAVAIGHVMRKLLPLAFAVWKTGKPFDPHHCPWHAPAQVDLGDNAVSVDHEPTARNNAVSGGAQAAGRGPDVPARSEVTAAGARRGPQASAGGWLDFAPLKAQLPLARVRAPRGLTPRLKGSGPPRRGPCPLHRGDQRGRTFSVNLDATVCHGHAARCGKHGDVIDLWAAGRGRSLRAAALDRAATFNLAPAPAGGTEQRNA